MMTSHASQELWLPPYSYFDFQLERKFSLIYCLSLGNLVVGTKKYCNLICTCYENTTRQGSFCVWIARGLTKTLFADGSALIKLLYLLKVKAQKRCLK